MTIKPLGNRLVVRLAVKKNVSASGIILSSEQKNEQSIGQIIAIGGGIGEEENVTELKINIGDTVMFGKYSGEEVADEQDSEIIYKIINGKDVLAVIEN